MRNLRADSDVIRGRLSADVLSLGGVCPAKELHNCIKKFDG